MKKYEYLITPGIEKALNTVAFHHEAPLTRYVMLEKDKVDGDGGLRIVSHIVNSLPENVPPYCELHWHEFDEINLILSEDNSLKYRIRLEDETYEVSSPSTVYIPKGIKHSAEAISGKGIFLAINPTKNYTSKQ
jgi:uncharacterized RmlC-like cupin family protein